MCGILPLVLLMRSSSNLLSAASLLKSMFNHQARWDRQGPCDKNETYFSQPLKVLCVIEKGKITPRSLFLNNSVLKIQKTNFSWEERRGSKLYQLFSVTTDQGTYQIAFERMNLSWHLIKLLHP